jgi:hypothetical protein
MSAFERITITLSSDLLNELDRRESNRSKFIADAVRRELAFRRREDLRRSLQNPHPESDNFAEWGLEGWHDGIPHETAGDLLNSRLGQPIRWIPGVGWTNAETSID